MKICVIKWHIVEELMKEVLLRSETIRK